MATKPIPRPSPPKPPPPVHTAVSTSDFSSRWPLLFSYLFDERYEDGSARVTATLSFFTEKGMLKACLNDRDTRRVAFLVVGGPMEALDALEAGLDQDNLDWRQKRD